MWLPISVVMVRTTLGSCSRTRATTARRPAGGRSRHSAGCSASITSSIRSGSSGVNSSTMCSAIRSGSRFW